MLRAVHWNDCIVVGRMEGNICGDFLRKPEEERQLGIPISGWKDNIKMDIKE
jgi:hypothetical protein